ncbi:MAG: Flp pilus assembly protein CpaB, partial [Candidatus Bipolaricaulia bacterium]
MTRKRVLVIVLLGLISGLIAAVGASRHLSKIENGAGGKPPPKLETVVVAKTSVAQGERLRREDVEATSWPASVVPPSAFRRVEEVQDRVTSVRLIKGEPILAGKLAPAGSSPGLSALVSPGMRGVTVRVNDVSGVAGFLVPGSRVDVVTTIDVDREKGSTSTVSKVILQDVKVLAVGQRTEPNGNKPKKASAVTLLVSPAQAERLALASTRGTIQLALRSTPDRSASYTRGVTPPQLIYGSPPKTTKRVERRARPKTLKRTERKARPKTPKRAERKARPKTPRRKPRAAPVPKTSPPKPEVIEVFRGTKRSLEPV